MDAVYLRRSRIKLRITFFSEQAKQQVMQPKSDCN